jgi:hypothetical protein
VEEILPHSAVILYSMTGYTAVQYKQFLIENKRWHCHPIFRCLTIRTCCIPKGIVLRWSYPSNLFCNSTTTNPLSTTAFALLVEIRRNNDHRVIRDMHDDSTSATQPIATVDRVERQPRFFLKMTFKSSSDYVTHGHALRTFPAHNFISSAAATNHSLID